MKDLSLLEIYHKYLESKDYKLLKVSVIDHSSALEKKLEYWAKDSDRVHLEIIDENICFLYKQFVLQTELPFL
jgi:hypothetical protein